MNKKEILVIVLIVIISILIIGAFVYFNQPEKVIDDPRLDTFAKCLTEKGLTMYAASWCKFCAEEKKAFGSSFKYINYVECPENIQLCLAKGIQGYPTWLDEQGNKYESKQGLAKLSEISGCDLPE